MVDSWPLERAELVARAFTVYFHLVNLAEEHQRIRTLRDRDAGTTRVRESLAEVVPRIPADALDGLVVYPVFTAHPTEARRRAVVAALRTISVRLADLDDLRGYVAALAELEPST